MKTKMLIASVIFSVIALTLGACAAGSSASGQTLANVKVSCDTFQVQPKYTSNVSVATNGTLTVTLCSNSSTGYSWVSNAQISDTSVLQQTDHKTVASNNNMPGAPGQEAWTFKALKKGATKVSFEYSQPWSGGTKGAWTVNLDVTIN